MVGLKPSKGEGSDGQQSRQTPYIGGVLMEGSLTLTQTNLNFLV
jgi:hypothetical protein